MAVPRALNGNEFVVEALFLGLSIKYRSLEQRSLLDDVLGHLLDRMCLTLHLEIEFKVVFSPDLDVVVKDGLLYGLTLLLLLEQRPLLRRDLVRVGSPVGQASR